MERLASPKSRIFTWPGRLDHDVRALQIAMDDAAFVRARDAGGDLAGDVEELRRFERRR